MVCKCKKEMLETHDGFFCESCYQYMSKEELVNKNLKKAIFGPTHIDRQHIKNIVHIFKHHGYKISEIDACLAYLFAMDKPISVIDTEITHYNVNSDSVFLWLKDYFYIDGGGEVV